MLERLDFSIPSCASLLETPHRFFPRVHLCLSLPRSLNSSPNLLKPQLFDLGLGKFLLRLEVVCQEPRETTPINFGQAQSNVRKFSECPG